MDEGIIIKRTICSIPHSYNVHNLNPRALLINLTLQHSARYQQGETNAQNRCGRRVGRGGGEVLVISGEHGRLHLVGITTSKSR